MNKTYRIHNDNDVCQRCNKIKDWCRCQDDDDDKAYEIYLANR